MGSLLGANAPIEHYQSFHLHGLFQDAAGCIDEVVM